MVAQLLVSVLILATVTYFLLLNFRVTKKVVDDIHHPPAASPRTVDAGYWGTLKLAWKFRTTLWDDIGSYQRILDALQEYSCKMARFIYLTNWTSAARLVLCSDLKTCKDVLRSSKWINRFHDDHYIYLGSFGKPLGILLGNGHYWKAARKVVMAAFREHGIMEPTRLEALFTEEIHVVLNDLRARVKRSTTDHAVFSPNDYFDEAMINVLFQLLFSRKPSLEYPLERELEEMIRRNNEIFTLGFCVVDYFPFLKYVPKLTTVGREGIKFCEKIYTMVDNERKRRNLGCGEYQDIMDTFLKEVKEHEGTNPNYFSYENLQTTMRDLIMAGSDTIHVSLQHLLLYMATNKKEQEKVQEEIDRVIGPDRFPTYEDRKSMIYTQAVLQETWRLGSVVPSSHRMASQDCELGGMAIKKGTYLTPVFVGVHYDGEVWEDPLAFKPTRFISETGQITNTDKTLAFSYGPRSCPGELMARVGAFLFTVTLLREFEWELSDLHPPPSNKSRRGLTRVPNEYFVKIRHRLRQC